MTDDNTKNGTTAVATMPDGSTSLAVGDAQEWFEPQNLQQALEVAKLYSQSGLLPPEYSNKPGAVLLAMQFGRQLGIGFLAAVQNISVVNGRPAIWGDLALALVKRHPDYDSIVETDNAEVEGGTATCVVRRRGEQPVERSFSMEDAKRAGLFPAKEAAAWTKYPKRMRQMRARAWALRDSFPDAIKGLGVTEEERDRIVEARVVDEGGAGDTATERLKDKLAKRKQKQDEPVDVEHAPAQDDDAALREIVEKIRAHGKALGHQTDKDLLPELFPILGKQPKRWSELTIEEAATVEECLGNAVKGQAKKKGG